jgi:GNAT superfamily N-acetyltransferase
MTTCIVQVSPQVGSHELNELFASAWPDHRETDFAPLLECALFYVCAYQDKRLVGFAKVIGDGGVHGFLLDPTVAFDRQRNGIGKQLVNACMEEARGRGIAWLHVDYVPQLRQFYASCGLRPQKPACSI